MKPMSPKEAQESAYSSIPDAVYDVFNRLLSERYDDGIRIEQEEVVSALRVSMAPEDFAKVFERNWLDVEPMYRKAGWKVEFDKPGYNEEYGAFWMFFPKGRRR